MKTPREIAGEGVLWLLCAVMGTVINPEVWPAIPIEVAVFTIWAAASALRRAGH